MTAIAKNADFAFVTRLPESLWSARLVLRTPNRGDVASMARLANNKSIYKWLSRLPHPYGEADALAFVDTVARSRDEHAFSILTRDGDFIGVIGLHLCADGTTEIGYWLGEPYWGDGYGSEAVSALLAATDAAGCDRLEARAQTLNFASCRVLEKSGFVETSRHIASCGPHQGVSITSFRRERLR